MANLERFGRLVAEDLRDAALNRCLDIESGWEASEKMKIMSSSFSSLSEEQRAFVRNLVTECIDTGVHEFLFALAAKKYGLQLEVDGQEIDRNSVGLQVEIHTENGWFEKYSQHGEKGI